MGRRGSIKKKRKKERENERINESKGKIFQSYFHPKTSRIGNNHYSELCRLQIKVPSLNIGQNAL
jgi:hypothetical protein